MPAAYAEHVAGMDLLVALQDSLAAFRGLAPRLTPERWARPLAPGKWTLAEIMLHVAQWELIGAVRIRSALAQTSCRIQPLEQDALMRVEGGVADGPRALAAFGAVRELNIALAAGLSAGESARTCEHPERGTQTVDDLLTTLAGHAIHHYKQIASCLE